MIKNKNSIWLIEMPRLCLIIFFIFQVISILTYSGGTLFNNDNEGYSFTRNFLSDLGRYLSFSMENNFFSCQFFNMSLIMSGCIFIIFYINVRNIFVGYKYSYIAFFGTAFGVMGGIALISVGLTPSDLYLSLHDFFAKWLFRCFFLAAICYSIVIYYSNFFDNKYAFGYILFAFSILFYIIISELGPSPNESEFSLTFQVVAQKIILIIMFISLYIQTLGLEKLRD